MSRRDRKIAVRQLLISDDVGSAVDGVCAMPARRVVNDLFSLLLDADELIRWRSATAMGAVIARLAGHQMESARVIMRRMMWMLNDESGGIGWGIPESMGETVAVSEPLAREYGHILVSYIDPAGNYLEHPVLQRGLLWGLGRYGHAQPHAAALWEPLLLPFLDSADPYHRGLGAWTMGAVSLPHVPPQLASLTSDAARFRFYTGSRLEERSVAQMAGTTIAGITAQSV